MCKIRLEAWDRKVDLMWVHYFADFLCYYNGTKFRRPEYSQVFLEAFGSFRQPFVRVASASTVVQCFRLLAQGCHLQDFRPRDHENEDAIAPKLLRNLTWNPVAAIGEQLEEVVQVKNTR